MPKRSNWRSDRIRKTFIEFFEEREHKAVPSASLVPHGDPTLLFTSAGMVQFKPYFEGRAQPALGRRLCSVQKCFRTSDIDNVGDSSHLTFFEMLGNFSVGDYFKEEAIAWAWELLTEVVGLPKEHLWAAVFLDDDEAFDLWRKVGVPVERILRYGEEDNYWFSGDVGPCGPCSEIYYDFGPTPGCAECEKGICHPQIDCHDEHGVSRFLELWNLVFMTFFQHEDGSRTPLPAKNIDTGAGLERWASVLQGGGDRMSVYETDLFAPIIAKVAELSGRKYGDDVTADRAMRIVAEHARAAAFLIADGVMPSNEGRGYALRKMIRRAVYYGQQVLGLQKPFLAKTGAAVVPRMRTVYTELQAQQELIGGMLKQEEMRFLQTLHTGLQIWDYVLISLASIVDEWAKRVLAALASRESEEWIVPIKDANSKAKDRIIGLTVTSGSIQPGIPVELPPRVTATKAARQLISRRKDTFEKTATECARLTNPGKILQRIGAPNLSRPDVLKRVRQDIASTRPKLEAYVNSLVRSTRQLTGQEAFTLWDTHGFPLELTREIAHQQGFEIDEEGFQVEMEAQQERARAAHKFGVSQEEKAEAYASLSHLATSFLGYETLRHETTVAGIIASAGGGFASGEGTEAVDSVDEGDEAEIVLRETPFYAEAGGQVGDRGEIVGPSGRFAVEDTQYAFESLIVHRGRVVEGLLAVNDDVVAQVDAERRADTMRNHTGTHLLHSALRQVLGTHVRQAGSLVTPDRLRFDFTHMEAPKPEELTAVQALVNEKIRENVSVGTEQKSYEEAISGGALAFFGEKYAENVRVVEVGEPDIERRFSAELCGGTHCHATGEVGTLVIVKEESIGAGVRRIEALTGRAAAEYVREQQATLERLGRSLDASPSEIEAKVASLQEELAAVEKRARALERQAARREAETLLEQAERPPEADGAAVVVSRVSAASPELLREMGDFLRDRLGSAVIALGAVVDGRPSFVVMATPDLTARGLHAGEIVKGVAAVAGGGGGGRPEMAQAGGKDADKLDDALATGGRLIRKRLGSLSEASAQTTPPAERPRKSGPDKPSAGRRSRTRRPGRASGRP